MNTITFYGEIDSPLGRMLVRGDGQFVTGLFMPCQKGSCGPDASWKRCDALFDSVRTQLAQYFAGERREFDVPLRLTGTPFQRRVWQELVRIPFGTTMTYGQLARRVGNLAASRAVGRANGCNPVSIIVPCHRVIGADGTLTGYAGGLDKKRWLLDWERRTAPAASGPLFDAAKTGPANGPDRRVTGVVAKS